ncbi:MAG TPA: hypothetical protein VM938_10730 [Acidimicrobiales bacterium]|nr:hypothetical protein [Acidimicrobiales bacterium]
MLNALFAPGSCHRFQWVVRGLAVLIGVRVALGPYRALAGQPGALFRPVWFLELLPAMPSAAVFVALQVVGVAGALGVLALRGRRRWVAFVVAWLAYLVLAGLRSSLGKTLHNDVLLLLAAVPFLWPVSDDDEADCGWPVRLASAVVASGYFFAGLAKLRHSGLAWVTGDNMRYILSWAVIDGRMRFDSWTAWVADRAWLSTASAAGILALELGAPVAVAVRVLRPAFVGAAAALHVATWFLLGLDYWAWIGTVVVVLVDWDRLRAPAAAE